MANPHDEALTPYMEEVMRTASETNQWSIKGNSGSNSNSSDSSEEINEEMEIHSVHPATGDKKNFIRLEASSQSVQEIECMGNLGGQNLSQLVQPHVEYPGMMMIQESVIQPTQVFDQKCGPVLSPNVNSKCVDISNGQATVCNMQSMAENQYAQQHQPVFYDFQNSQSFVHYVQPEPSLENLENVPGSASSLPSGPPSDPLDQQCLSFDNLPDILKPTCDEDIKALYLSMTAALQQLDTTDALEIYNKYPKAFQLYSNNDNKDLFRTKSEKFSSGKIKKSVLIMKENAESNKNANDPYAVPLVDPNILYFHTLPNLMPPIIELDAENTPKKLVREIYKDDKADFNDIYLYKKFPQECVRVSSTKNKMGQQNSINIGMNQCCLRHSISGDVT